MKKTILYFLCLGAIALLCSAKCSSTSSGDSDKTNTYYSGKLSVDADGVPIQFVDCATHITMNINIEENYKKVTKKLKKSADSGVIFVSFSGEIVRTEAELEAVPGSITPTITINNIISVGDDSVCFPEFVLAGLYSSSSDETSESRVLHLRPHYTYTLTKFLTNGTQIKSEGVWYRSDKLNIILKERDTDREPQILKVAPAEEVLKEGEGEGEIIYSKLYI